jgi:hypothetical protein
MMLVAFYHEPLSCQGWFFDQFMPVGKDFAPKFRGSENPQMNLYRRFPDTASQPIVLDTYKRRVMTTVLTCGEEKLK